MLTAEEVARYERQLVLPGFGATAQERLRQGRVLVVGAGGLGSSVLLHLVAAGVGHVRILDDDVVGVSNLQRQILYTEDDLGQPKAQVAAARLRRLNSLIRIEGRVERLSPDTALSWVTTSDVVVDASDNFATRYLIDDACVRVDRPWIHGAVQGYSGQLSVFNWRGGPSYRCLFPEPPAVEERTNPGVLGVVPGVIGPWQAAEVLKILSGVGEPLSGRLLLWDALTMRSRTLTVPSRRSLRAPPLDSAVRNDSSP